MPVYFADVLPRTSPEEQGIASRAILEFIEAIEHSEQELHSFMPLKNGCVTAEGWWTPYGPEIPHMVFLLSESFTSTAVGMAVAERHFTVDDAVLSFFPDETPDQVTENLAAMRVRHILSMSTGHDVPTFPLMVGREDGNWAKGFFEIPWYTDRGHNSCTILARPICYPRLYNGRQA